MDERFLRNEMLWGKDGQARLTAAHVIVFGLGGVGSYVTECLARAGVGELTLVDSDTVALSNLNRQLEALDSTVGLPKAEAVARRIRDINPYAVLHPMEALYNADNREQFFPAGCRYDYIVDAIDSLKDKAALILLACQTRAVLFSSMGAALKMDPTRIRVAEFWKVRGCPLGAALRKRMKRAKTIPAHKFQCVYSEELLENRGTDTGDDPCSFQKAQINGSMSHITAIFGFTIAGLVLDDIYRKALNK